MLPQGPSHILESMARSWVRLGLIRSWRLHVDFHDDRLVLIVSLASRANRNYEFTGSELSMGGEAGLWAWISRVEADLRHHFIEFRSRLEGPHTTPPPVARPRRDTFDDHLNNPWRRTKISRANETAQKLFAMVAGEKAYETLKAGRGLYIKGSLGNEYQLFALSSYCVQRVRDGASLCAVVPGVPLWDHLLGIKLIIEHDEPKFLKIANVAFN